jgi:hypothetical protein
VNVSAPVSAPDLASLLLLPTAAPDKQAIVPGAAPTKSLKPGAAAPPSFEAALADLMSVGGGPDGKPEAKFEAKAKAKPEAKAEAKPAQDSAQPESKPAMTGVVAQAAAPAPPPRPLHLELALPVQPAARVEPDAVSAQVAAVSASVTQALPMTPPVTPQPKTLTPPAPTVTARKIAAAAPKLPDPSAPAGPGPAPASPIPEFHEQFPAAAVPLTSGREADLTPAPAPMPTPVSTVPDSVIIPDQAPLPELAHPAFTEKFTPMPMPAGRPTQATPVSQPLPAPSASAIDAVRPDHPASPAEPVQTDAPQHTSEQRHGDARDDHDSRQRPASEPAPTARLQSEPAAHDIGQLDQSRFQPFSQVSAPPRQAPAAEPLSQPSAAPQPGDIQREIDPTPLQPAPASHTADAHSITVRVTDASDQRVDLKITDRAGELKVAVRSADPNLAGSLRENLGDLVHRLEQNGLRAETWQPAQSPSDGPRQMRQTEGESFNGDHSGQQQQQSGDGRDRRQQDRPQRAAWLEEFESSFTPDSERSTTSWLPA